MNVWLLDSRMMKYSGGVLRDSTPRKWSGSRGGPAASSLLFPYNRQTVPGFLQWLMLKCVG